MSAFRQEALFLTKMSTVPVRMTKKLMWRCVGAPSLQLARTPSSPLPDPSTSLLPFPARSALGALLVQHLKGSALIDESTENSHPRVGLGVSLRRTAAPVVQTIFASSLPVLDHPPSINALIDAITPSTNGGSKIV